MMKVRPLAAAVATGALALVGLTSGPASAAIDQCKTGQLCFWHDKAYDSTFFYAKVSHKTMGSNSDEADSIYNRTSAYWVVYDDKDFDKGDRRFCVAPNKRVSNLAASQYKFGDKISSVERLSGHCPQEIPSL